MLRVAQFALGMTLITGDPSAVYYPQQFFKKSKDQVNRGIPYNLH